MTKYLLLLVSFVFCSLQNNFSSHILGGDVSIEQIGTNNFRVNLRFFRHCPGALSPISITDGKIYDSSNDSLIATVILLKDSTNFEYYHCATTSYTCKEILYYSGTVSLPNNVSGYYFSWANCCRVSPININSSTTFWTWTATFPSPNILTGNNSPVFKKNYSEHYMCINKKTNIDYSCTDADGDSLVYSLITPYNNASTKPFNPIQWNIGYSLTNIISGTCSIDSNGIVTVLPNTLGNFVVSVLCEEYRNGVKIGEVNREIELTSYNCNRIFTLYSDTICGISKTIGGKTYSSTGIYLDTLKTTLGCDSIITYDLAFKYIDTSTTFLNPQIMSNDTSAIYQWLDCNNSFFPIFGASGKNYTIIGNGSYAVEVNNNGCIDTSTCFVINNVDVNEKSVSSLVQFYPNPNNGILKFIFKENINVDKLYITDINGRIIQKIKVQNKLIYNIELKGNSGLYFLNIVTKETNTILKLIKK